jgi:hypothetical protein
MNNLVAKHDFNRASIHKDKNNSESNRKQKHKKDLKHVE